MRFTIMMKPEGKDVIEKWNKKGPYGLKILNVILGKGKFREDEEWNDMIAVEMKANRLVKGLLIRLFEKCDGIIKGHDGDELIFDDLMGNENAFSTEKM